VAAGRVFVLGTACVLRALEAASGKVLWQIDLKTRFGVELRQGCATSPFVRDGRLVVQAGGKEDHRVVALDPATGDLQWSSKGETRTFYSSPVVSTVGGRLQVLVHDATPGPPPVGGLLGLDLQDGKVLWRRSLEEGFSFDTPLLLPDDRLALLTWNDARLFRVKAGAGGAGATVEPLWKSADLKAYVAPPVARDGHLYGFGGDELVCLELLGGKAAWKEKLYPGSVILADGHLVALSVSAGLLRVVEATPAGYRERAKLQVFDRGSRAETPPSLAGRRIFARSEDEIAAVEVLE
jgi:outer membrane protein assembly factor BamB